MNRPARILVWGVGCLVLVLALALVGLKLYLTKDRILAWVVPPLEAQLGRRVVIADAGAGFTGIRLAGLDVRSEGAVEPLVSAGLIRVRWNLWALLRGTVQIDEVRLVEPRIRVVRLADGTLDIDDLLTRGEDRLQEVPAEPAAEPGRQPTPQGSAVGLAVALFSLENGRITFEDQKREPAGVYVLDAIDSRLFDFALDRPTRFELSARLPLAEAGRFSLAGTVHPATGDTAAKVAVTAFDLPGLNPLMGDGMRFAGGTFGLDLDVTLSGGAHAAVQGSARVARLALSSGAEAGPATDVVLDLDAAADLAGGTAEVRRLDLQAGDQTVRAQAKVQGLHTRPRVDFVLASEELRVDPLLALLPPADPASPGATQGAQGASAPGAAEPAPVPVDAFGDVRIGRVLVGGAAIEALEARVALEKGVLVVEPAGAQLYGGTLRLTARAELENPGPPFAAGVDLAGTQLTPLLTAFAPAFKDTLTGTLGLALRAQGLGGDLATLRSQTQAEAKDGKILNHPLAQNLAALFQVKELETLNFYSLRADVETAEGVGQVKSLVLSGPNLQATATGTVGLTDRALDLRLAVALPRELAARLVREPNTLAAVTDAQGWSRLPLRLRGTVDAPSYGLDAEGLREAAARAVGGKVERVLEEKVLDKLPVGEEEKGQLQEGLRRLLGR
ncbi:MAG: AsmA family protein [Thermodesulfobacteriota bacterium]